jgi:hypothetical protein
MAIKEIYTEIEVRNLCLRVYWYYEPSDSEVGIFNDAYVVDDVEVGDSEGEYHRIQVSDTLLAEIEEKVREHEEALIEMDREP